MQPDATTDVYSIDFETHSAQPIQRGIWAYAQHPSTKILMMSFHCVGDPPPQSVSSDNLWVRRQPFPDVLRRHIAAGGKFSGWNPMNFERLIWKFIGVEHHDWPPVDDDAWLDSMHIAAAANLPRNLDAAARSVGSPVLKDKAGHGLMLKLTQESRTPWAKLQYVFTKPIANEPAWLVKLRDEFARLSSYCVTDSIAEEEAVKRFPPWPTVYPWADMPAIDRRINDRGILMDVELVQGMAKAADLETAYLNEQMSHVTGGKVPSCSVVEQLKAWLIGRGVELPLKAEKRSEEDQDDDDEDDDGDNDKVAYRLRARDIEDLLVRPDLPEDVELALRLRYDAAKASSKKLRAMLRAACSDGRIRGCQTLMGAQQTGRFSAGIWQPYNFPRKVLPDREIYDAEDDYEAALYRAVADGRSGDNHRIRACWGAVLPFISRMLRRTIVAPQGRTLLQGDFKSIEAILVDWLAQQQNMLHAWRTGGDVYRLTAAPYFGIAPEELSKLQRQSGKVTKLALNFLGGEGALISMAFGYGLKMSKEEAKPIVESFRQNNQDVMQIGKNIMDCAINAVRNPGYEYYVAPLGIISYFMWEGALLARLPSGRCLRYWAPEIGVNEWGKPTLTVVFVKGPTAFRRSTWSGRLLENLAQSMGVELLVRALARLDRENFETILHVYDSAAAEIDENKAHKALAAFTEAMVELPNWAQAGGGLPLSADVHINSRFG